MQTHIHTNKPIHLCHFIHFHGVSNGRKHSNNILMKLDKHKTYIHTYASIQFHLNTQTIYTKYYTHGNASVIIHLGKFEIVLTTDKH